MNPLGNGNVGGMPPQFHQNIQQVKGLMQMAQGNPIALAQQNPAVAQVMQMCQGKDPQKMFYDLCKQMNVDPETILNELRM